MAEMLKGKVCIVTGASRGIGLAISRIFEENGAEVFAVSTGKHPIEETKHIHPVYFDITDESAMRKAILQIKKQAGKINVLVNNAGVEYNERIGMIDREKMEETFRVNVFGTIDLLQLAARVMGKNPEGGSIINITSTTAIYGNAGQAVYAASKGAIISLTKSAAKELAPQNIRVNAIAPGLTDTDMVHSVASEKLQKRIDNILLGRIAQPEDIAKAVLFLASDLSGYISGQILSVDGCTIM